MTLSAGRRRLTTLCIVAMLSLQLVLISEHMKPVKAQKRGILAIKAVLAYLYLLKKKKPKIGLLPIPLPLPIPFKIEKKEPPVIVHKKKHQVKIHHNVPVPQPVPEYYPVEQEPSYIDGGYMEEGGYEAGGHGGGYGGGYEGGHEAAYEGGYEGGYGGGYGMEEHGGYAGGY